MNTTEPTTLEQAITERDAALKAVAEMRGMIFELLCRFREWEPSFFDHPDDTDLGQAVKRAKAMYESSDCGKGYVHVDTVKPLVEALKQSDAHLAAVAASPNHDTRKANKQALAHWEKVTQSKTTP